MYLHNTKTYARQTNNRNITIITPLQASWYDGLLSNQLSCRGALKQQKWCSFSDRSFHNDAAERIDDECRD